MGLLGKYRSETGSENGWALPAFGACECEGHIEDVLELRIPLADPPSDGPVDMAVWALVTSGGLATVPLAEERRHLSNGVTVMREGPFHWKVLAGAKYRPFLSGGDVRRLEIATAGQPGVERAMWMHRDAALVIGAPRLCVNGVQCAVVQALRSAFVREGAVRRRPVPA